MGAFALDLRCTTGVLQLGEILEGLQAAGIEPSARETEHAGRGRHIVIQSYLSRWDIHLILDGELGYVECVLPLVRGTMYHFWSIARVLRDLGCIDATSGERPYVPRWAESRWQDVPAWRRALQR